MKTKITFLSILTLLCGAIYCSNTMALENALLGFSGGIQTTTEYQNIVNFGRYSIVPFGAVEFAPVPYVDFSAKFTLNHSETLGWDTETKVIYPTDIFSPYIAFDVTHGQQEKFFSLHGIDVDLGIGFYYTIPEELIFGSSIEIYGNHLVNKDKMIGAEFSKSLNPHVLLNTGGEYAIKLHTIEFNAAIEYIL